MDTKSKNPNSNDRNEDIDVEDVKTKNIETRDIKKHTKINIYSKKLKILAVMSILIIAFLITYFLNFFYSNAQYYNGTLINEYFSTYCYDTVDVNLNLRNEQHIREFYEKRYNNDDNGNISEMNSIIESRTQDMYDKTTYIDEAINFVYIIENRETGEIYRNLENNPQIVYGNGTYSYNGQNYANPTDILKQQKYYIGLKDGRVAYNERNLNIVYDINQLINNTNSAGYELHFALIEPFVFGDLFYNVNLLGSEISIRYRQYIVMSIICMLLLFVLTLYLVFTAGRNERHGEPSLKFMDKIYIDIHTLAVIFFVFILQNTMRYSSYMHPYLATLCFLAVPIGVNYLCSVSRLLKAGLLFKSSFSYHLFSSYGNFFKDFNEIYKDKQQYSLWSIIFVILALVVLNGVWYAQIFVQNGYLDTLNITIILTVILDSLFILWIIIIFISLKRIITATSKISDGDIKYTIDMKKIPSTLKSLAVNIMNIQNGLSSAVDKALKGERLKTELITNVSHDLKTPLTSIINYVDLLKKEDLHSERATEYIGILEEKAERLKNLIDDLTEASKASSGNISIVVEKLDLNQLVMQSCGEYEERLSKRKLDIRVSVNDTQRPVFIAGEGKHMWRILSNILSNISKYALPNSRVYININQNSGYGVLTVKNISDGELDIAPEQLTERFVRGDASRTTEGSGLGLSIAQSLTELQGGTFSIDIDGDLFKVLVEIPLWS